MVLELYFLYIIELLWYSDRFFVLIKDLYIYFRFLWYFFFKLLNLDFYIYLEFGVFDNKFDGLIVGT